MIAPLGGALQLCGHLVNQYVQEGGLVNHLHLREPLADVHAVPSHGVHLGAELPSGQWLTQGLRLLHDVPRHSVTLGAELLSSQRLTQGFHLLYDVCAS
jgi:hypothetical protein